MDYEEFAQAAEDKLRIANQRIAELERRLEIDPEHGWDGIAARDETIRQLERERIDSQAQLMVERRELLERLAAAQATISRKDEALRAIREDFASDKTITGRVQRQAEDAINLNSDRTALDAMLAEAETKERERICQAIKDEDGHCVTNGDYMLDSDDCILVARGMWKRPEFAGESQAAERGE